MPVSVASRGLHEAQCNQTQTSWEELIGWLRRAAGSPEPVKEAIPLFSFATFSGGIHKHHVTQVTGALLDYDGTSHEQLVAVLQAAHQFRGFAYTTYSHAMKGEPPCRFRIALELDESCPPQQWEALWYRLRAKLGSFHKHAPDTSTRDPGRFFFVPAQNPNGPPCWFDAWDGPPVNVRALLAEASTDDPIQIEDLLDGSEPVQLNHVQALASKLQRRPDSESKTIGRQIENGIRGLEFVLEGNRDNQCWKIAGELAKEFARGNSIILSEFFRAALEFQGTPTTEQFRSQIERQQQNVLRQEAQKRALRKDQQTKQPTGEPGTPANGKPVVNDIPLLVQFKRQYWLRDIHSRDFINTYSHADVELAIVRTYAEHSANGLIPLHTQEGEVFALRKLLNMYSSPAKTVKASYLATENSYDVPTQTLTLAPAKRRQLTPTYHPEIDHWLRLMCGSNYPDVESWIRGLARLDMPSPALYLWGAGGAGKTLLGFGLGKIWEQEVCGFADVVGNFNGKIVENPLVLADEGFPPETKFTWLRSFLSVNTRRINEKYQAPIVLHGHARLIVTANNAHSFELDRKALTQDDTSAIAERVMQIQVEGAARQFLESLGSVRHWVDQNLIAEHALWLMMQPAEPVTGRWAVVAKHGDPNAFGAALTERNLGWFVHWLAQYFTNPKTIEIRYAANLMAPWYLRTYEGKLLIHPMAFEYLDKYTKHTQVEFKHAIHFFRLKGSAPIQIRVRGNPRAKINYIELDLPRVISAIRELVDSGIVIDILAEDTEKRIGP